MLLLVALAAQAASPPPVPVQSTATVRIERPATASRRDWERLPDSRKRETVVRDDKGRPVLLRIVENE